MRVLHVLHHSVPCLDGYGVRSRSILNFQRAAGLAPVAVTSVHHEIELGRRDAVDALEPEVLDGIRYYRTPLPTGPGMERRLRTPFFRERTLMEELRTSIERTLAREPVDLIHAHSPVLCGAPALESARRHRLPLVYEVRAFWEDALLSSAQSPLDRIKYRYSRRLETQLLKRADAVVAISDRMLDEIESRGVGRQRLHKIANGVDAQQFAAARPFTELRSRLGLGNGPIVGFIGTFFNFEGLDCLVRAMPAVLARVPDAHLVLVGTGESEGATRQLVDTLGLAGHVRLTGRVPHEEVPAYYGLMDLLVYPRHRDRVTELVTPLKPLEAMAAGRAVIGSDVGGIKELLDEGRQGRLFKAGDADDLARAVIALLSDPDERARLAARGREYVVRHRGWPDLVAAYRSIYEKVLSSATVVA
jgi:PEP-CTERM/exosortase A-associated glycosyltransferase